MTTRELFRKQAKQHYSERMSGTIVLTPSVLGTYFMWFLFLFFLSFTWVLFEVSFPHRVTVSGIVDSNPKLLKINGKNGLIVKDILVSVGQSVAPGQPLLIFEEPQVLLNGRTPDAELRSVLVKQREQFENAQLSRSKSQAALLSGLENQIATMLDEVLHVEKQVATLREKQEIILNLKDAYKELFDKSIISKVTWGQTLKEEIDVRVEIETLTRQKLAYIRSLEELKSKRDVEIEKNSLMNIQSGLELSDLDQKIISNSKSSSYAIKAQQGGIVTDIYAAIGDKLTDDQVAINIAPEKKKTYIKAFVPRKYIADLNYNQTVNIRYDSFPYEKYGRFVGSIQTISSIALNANEIPQKSGLCTDSCFEVHIDISSSEIHYANKVQMLRDGLTAQIDILQDERTIFEWLFKPLIQLSR